jgi:hypothetical protein
VELFVYRSPDVVLGLSNLLSGLDTARAASVRSELGFARLNPVESSLTDYVAGQADLNLVFDANELKDRETTKYVFLSGTGSKILVPIEGNSFESKPIEMVVFDRNRKPLLVADIDMLVPTK